MPCEPPQLLRMTNCTRPRDVVEEHVSECVGLLCVRHPRFTERLVRSTNVAAVVVPALPMISPPAVQRTGPAAFAPCPRPSVGGAGRPLVLRAVVFRSRHASDRSRPTFSEVSFVGQRQLPPPRRPVDPRTPKPSASTRNPSSTNVVATTWWHRCVLHERRIVNRFVGDVFDTLRAFP